ncbi:MAG: DUF1573 domain-containing protein [Candidatus Hydrogenedentes bacterium]|nr:DUF1573 domain-containing protein [Candidatus Hydrogenedentota bacterium]
MLFVMRYVTVGGLILALGCFLLSGVHGESAEGPKLHLSTMEIDLGTVKPIDGIERIVEIRNTGTETLEIIQVGPLCSCVAVSKTSLVVEPGAIGTLAIQAMLSTYPSNDVKGKVRLYTNDAMQPEVDITLRAKITPEYIIDKTKLDFGTLKAGGAAAQTFVVRQNGDLPLRIERVEASKGLSATVEEIHPKKDESEDQPRRYTVTVALEPVAPQGAFRGAVTVFTNCVRIPKAELKVSAQVAGLDYSVTPKVLAFGTASPGDTLGAFVVKGEGINVTEAQADKAGLVFEIYEVEAGREYRVEAIVTKDAATGRLLSMVTLRVGEGSLFEEVKVRVFGQIK